MRAKFVYWSYVDADDAYMLLDFEVSPAMQTTTCGQYVSVKCGDVEQYCVVVEATNAGSRVSFLTRRTSKLCVAIRDAAAHESSEVYVDVSRPMGGFDVSDVADRDVVCFAGGSGIGGIVSVLDCEAMTSARSTTTFYSETRGEFAFPNRSDVLRFKTEGAMSSNPGEPILGMVAKLSGVVPVSFPSRPIVYACGGKGYVDRLREALVPVLVDAGDFRVNF